MKPKLPTSQARLRPFFAILIGLGFSLQNGFSESGETEIRDRFSFEFRNPSFEEAGDAPEEAFDWKLPDNSERRKGTSVRSDGRASDGTWAMLMEVGSEHTVPEEGIAIIGQQEIVEPQDGLYDWNSDMSLPFAFRPGMVTGFSLDTQAVNLGQLSSFGAGEPPNGICYIDIPVKASVK